MSDSGNPGNAQKKDPLGKANTNKKNPASAQGGDGIKDEQQQQ